ncbi:Calcipressin-1, partial [Rhizophlyctis rosea]
MGIPNHITINPPAISLFEPDALATNTLILANLAPQAFENEGSAVRVVLERFGRVVRLSLLKSFLRVVVVFDSTADSQHAKDALHMVEFLGRELRVYFGDHTDTTHLSNPSAQPLNFLRVPEPEKNFLLSPPGSPPIGWVQLRESSPVSGGHNDALLDALHQLENDEGAQGMEFVLDAGSAITVEEEEE